MSLLIIWLKEVYVFLVEQMYAQCHAASPRKVNTHKEREREREREREMDEVTARVWNDTGNHTSTPSFNCLYTKHKF